MRSRRRPSSSSADLAGRSAITVHQRDPGLAAPRERIYPPVGTLALDLLYDALDAEAQSFRQLDGQASAGLPAAPPIDRDKIPV
jgi:hypothetical protein